MGKGILMERNGGKAVVLTPQGEFKRVSVPRGTWDIGDEIEYADARPAAPWARWGLVAAAAAVFAIAPIGYQSWALAQPVAVVTIDINPSVELWLNKRDEVLKVQALNADGELVLDGVDWKRQPVKEVVASVTAKAVEVGKLDPTSETGAVVVAVAPIKEKALPAPVADRISVELKTSVESTLETEAKEQGKERKAASAVMEATPAEVKAAEDVGLTPGRLFIWEEIAKTVPDAGVKPEDLLKQGPGQLLRDLGISPKEVFGKSEEMHGSQNKKNDDKGKGNDKDKDKGKTGQSDDRPTLGTGGQNDDKGQGNDKNKEQNNGNGNGNGRDNPAGPAVPSVDKDKPSGRNPDGHTPPGQQKKDEPSSDNGNDDQESLLPRVILPGVGAAVEVKPAPDAKGNGNGKGNDKGQSGSDDKGKPQSDDKDDEKAKPSNGKGKGNSGR